MKIGIIGLGVVGQAVYDGLNQIGHSLAYYDIAFSESKIENILNSEIVFICVPTPCNQDGGCDISNVVESVRKLEELNFKGLVAIKSTVIPGTTQKLIDAYPLLKICFVPEFLRERSALTDFIDNHDVLIVGTNDINCYNLIVKSHKSIPKASKQVSPTEAEISKYFSNVFNSLRVVFANGMFDICKALNADYQNVFDAITQRTTITQDYLRCSEHLRGFSGHCLPKDSSALAVLTKQLNLNIDLFDAIVNDNKKYTK
jgi:UDPglucose 6-dehydrogenase